MARLRHRRGNLIIHLNPVEKIAALRRDVVVPLSSIISVEVVERPLTPPGVLDDLKLGFAARGAPEQRMATIGAWELRDTDGKALVVVYRNHPSIRIELDHTAQPWRRIVISATHPTCFPHFSSAISRQLMSALSAGRCRDRRMTGGRRLRGAGCHEGYGSSRLSDPAGLNWLTPLSDAFPASQWRPLPVTHVHIGGSIPRFMWRFDVADERTARRDALAAGPLLRFARQRSLRSDPEQVP